MRAVVDIGSNSIKYLLQESATEALPPGVPAMRSWTTGLGRGLGSTGRLSSESLALSESAFREMSEIFSGLRFPLEIKAVATSAVRDSTNPEEIHRHVQKHLHAEVRVLTGLEEARLSFEGALSAAKLCFPNASYLFVDIGGASTEVSYQNKQDQYFGHSFQAGAVRCHEDLQLGDSAVSDTLWAQAESQVAKFFPDLAWDKLMLDSPKFNRMIAVSGTLVAAAQASGATKHGQIAYSLNRSHLETFNNHLRQLSSKERVEQFQLDIGRADVLCSGILCVTHLMHRANIEDLMVTAWGLRHGVLAKWESL